MSAAMKMLKEDEETDAEVTWEDQKNINSFSKLNAKLSDLEEAYEEKKKEKEYLDDLATELEMVLDEDEPLLYRIGDTFVSLPLSSCQSRLEKDQTEISSQLDTIKSEMEGINAQMAKLKVILYGKFGKSINLERT
ncbi:hypothetical protein HK102_006961 [Quaeritorhiza haematococci]|nr:hypothetical protein HK102_006961 [Quaeritorhiza haematococci]